MAHQVHSLPWATLCSNFRYRKARSTSGPQYADLVACEDKPDLLKSVEHFARSFQTNLRLHAENNRRKHYTYEQYTRRARSWKTAVQNLPSETSPTESTQTLDAPKSQSPDEVRKQRNFELRNLQASLSQDWSVQPETRNVYPDYFHSRYSPHMYFPLFASLQSIDHWPAVPDPRPASSSSWPRALFEQCEVVKTLFIAAADLPPEAKPQRDHLIDTLFLLAHRPESLFHRYDGLGLSCCYMYTGLDGFIKRVAQCYVYLNMLFLYHEQAGGPSPSQPKPQVATNTAAAARSDQDHTSKTLTGMFDYQTEPEPSSDTYGSRSPSRCRDATPLYPWPTYARFRTYRSLVYSCCHRHEYQAENSLFVPFFFTFDANSASGLQYAEADILADPERLKLFVKKLWKILVIYEMVNHDRGLIKLQEQTDAENSQSKRQAKVNWEYVVLDGFSSVWEWRDSDKIFGMAFHNYVDQRAAKDPDHGFWLWGEV